MEANVRCDRLAALIDVGGGYGGFEDLESCHWGRGGVGGGRNNRCEGENGERVRSRTAAPSLADSAAERLHGRDGEEGAGVIRSQGPLAGRSLGAKN